MIKDGNNPKVFKVHVKDRCFALNFIRKNGLQMKII